VKSKVLFILKRREDYNAVIHSSIGLSTGLYNSASFMNEMLNEMGIESKLSVVIDNNCIDREVTKYKPTHVIIEALWVVPEKFAVLQKLHPKVKWIVRLHSEMPFMAGEGVAMDWVGDYSSFKNVILGINAPRMLREISMYIKHRNQYTDDQVKEKVIYLPNYYPQQYKTKHFNRDKEHIDIACFGAIRPLKNHLVQAFAAIDFANQLGKKLRFHVNAGRIEMNGSPVINNLKGLFEQIHERGHQMINHQWRPREEFLELCATMDIGMQCNFSETFNMIHERGHQMINHQWRPREEFLELCATMDIGMQCNFSETFNIVGADLVSQGVPLISNAKEIPWSIPEFCADPTDSKNIVDKLFFSYNFPKLNVKCHQNSLTQYTSETFKIWYKYFTH